MKQHVVHRMIITFLVFLIVAAGNLTASASGEKWAEFELGWLKLGDKADKVEGIFGQPNNKTERYMSDYYQFVTYHYNGLKVTFNYGKGENGRSTNVEVTGSELTTASGIRVGDTVAMLKQNYSSLSMSSRNGRDVYEYTVSPLVLSFTVNPQTGRIEAIALYYNV